MTGQEIQALIPELVVNEIGSPEVVVNNTCGLGSGNEDSLVFCKHSGAKLTSAISDAKFGVMLCDLSSLGEPPLAPEGSLLIDTGNPRLTYASVLNCIFPSRLSSSTVIHPTACVDETSKIGPGSEIGPNVVVGAGCQVGENCKIHGNVYIYPNTQIGNNVTIHANTTVGSDGFGYERAPDGSLVKFPHLGGVILEDDVEIGAGNSIARGTLGNTVVGKGTKTDNEVHIAHNVHIGKYVLITANVMIAGSVTIGDHVWLSPSCCIKNGLTIGDSALVGLGAVVLNNVKPHSTVAGTPAREIDAYKKEQMALRRLTRS